MTKFRPCIDLHDGRVKQIVGSSLSDNGAGSVRGGHVIMLGKGNVDAAKAALAAYPGGLQVGGGITADNALEYLDAGASHVIVTSWIFPDGKLDRERLERLSQTVGKERLVLDLSCKRVSDPEDAEPRWKIATNRWQTLIDIEITAETLEDLSRYCDEFLIHAADVEGKQQGMDDELIMFLAEHSPIPCTYAGGAKSLADLKHCKVISNGAIDLTIGSALDLFGGKGVKYEDCVRFNKA